MLGVEINISRVSGSPRFKITINNKGEQKLDIARCKDVLGMINTQLTRIHNLKAEEIKIKYINENTYNFISSFNNCNGVDYYIIPYLNDCEDVLSNNQEKFSTLDKHLINQLINAPALYS